MRRVCKSLNNSKGLTLVEVLASITILSIIIISFLAFFIQSARTNQVSENIMDATYVAQSEMEKIYNLSANNNFDSGLLDMVNLGYAPQGEVNNEYKFNKSSDGHYIVTTIEKVNANSKLGNVVVRVYESGVTNQLKAQMETIYQWEPRG